MGYQSGSEVWPSATFPNGDAVPKVDTYFGERYIGGVGGVTLATSGEGRMVFEFGQAAIDDGSLVAKELTIPEGFGAITSVNVETEVPFTTGDIQVSVGGVSILTAIEPVDGTAGISGAPITGAPVSFDQDDVVKILVAGAITGTATSYAKVIIEFTRV